MDEADIPLTSLQRDMWFAQALLPDVPLHNAGAALELDGPIDASALTRALQRVLDDTDALRLSFYAGDGLPFQRTTPRVAALAQHDLPDLDDRAFARWLQQEVARPFRLYDEYPVRFALIRRGDRHCWLTVYHHIALDEWSMTTVAERVAAAYSALCERREPRPDTATSMRVLARDDQVYADSPQFARDEAYWRGRHPGAPEPLFRRRAGGSSQGVCQAELALDATLSTRIRAFVAEHGASVEQLFAAALWTYFTRAARTDELALGVVAPLQPGAIGPLAATAPLRLRFDPQGSAVELLRVVRAARDEAADHHRLPLSRSTCRVGLPGDDRTRPFDLALACVERPALRLAGAPVTLRTVLPGHYPHGLHIHVEDDARVLRAVFVGDATLVDPAELGRLPARLCALLTDLLARPTAPVRSLARMSAEESQQILAWNAPAIRDERCVHAILAAQARRTPSAAAIVHGERQVRYDELERRANQIAHALRRCGVGPGRAVALLVERDPDAIAGLLGVLKAGGAYVPLDPDASAERLRWILDDTRAAPVLAQERVARRVLPGDPRVLHLDRDDWFADEPSHAPDYGASPGDLAYILYTSGSTGRPRGVLIEHHAVSNHCAAWQTILGDAPRRALQSTPLFFDAAIAELFPTLASGGTVHIPPPGAQYPGPELIRYLQDRRIQLLNITPTVLAALPPAALPDLEVLIVGGEACPGELVDRWGRDRQMWNAYGPTEVTCDATVARCEPGRGDPPIGRPIANVRAYVLDAGVGQAPIGEYGELCIGGVGVARGYLNDPDRTAERFVPDPFVADPAARMYRTADRARIHADGTIEFGGRFDHQIKLRGHRIELGEIEAVLAAAPTVAACAVLCREDSPGEPRLVAYVAPRPGPAPTVPDLRAHLARQLSAHMIPAAFVFLDDLPRTPTDKVDRRALPAPHGERAAEAYAAPRTPVEQIVADTYAQVLRVDRVGLGDDFFALGGHSLLGTQAITRLRAALGVDLPLRALFEAPTVEALGRHVVALQGAGHRLTAIPRVPRDRPLPLSFGQQRLWFLHRLEPGRATYNVAEALRLRGPLDHAALERALGEVVRRHEALRTVFVETGEDTAQVVLPVPATWPLPVIALRAADAAATEAEIHRQMQGEAARPFNLEAGPVFRSTLLRAGPEHHVLLLSLHHILSDGWSIGVLCRELEALYTAFRAGQPSPLPALTVQLADVSAWQRATLQGGRLEQELAYWREQLRGCPPLALPTDHPRPKVFRYRGATLPVTVAPAQAAALKRLAQQHGATLFMVLMAGFQVLLARYSQQDDFCVGWPIANRTRAEMEPMIGFFANTLVLRARLAEDPTFLELLARVRQACLEAYTHQDLPFERLVDDLGAQRDLGRNSIFQVMFVLQNAPYGALRLPDLDVAAIPTTNATAKFDLAMSFEEQPDGGLLGVIEYASDLFETDTMTRLRGHYLNLLVAIVDDPYQTASRLSLLSADERRAIVDAGSRTAAPWPQDQCVHQRFAAQVAATPDALAVARDDRRLTYAELDAQAGRLADHLRGHGVGPDVLVGLCVERSIELVVAVLGVLKAGGAYLPLDPQHPRDRLAFMLDDARPPVIVVQRGLHGCLPETAARRLELEALAELPSPACAPPPATTAADLAYVLYTSGSTGRPKGVAVEHRSVINLVHAQARDLEIGPGRRMLQFASLNFDVSAWELLTALCNGASVHLGRTEQTRDPAALRAWVAREEVDIAAFPAVLLAALSPGDFPSLRTVIAGGEVAPADVATAWAAGRRLFNAYGPTEATVCATMAEIAGDVLPPIIGRPLANVEVHVLDRHLQPVPLGVPGELFIGGAGLARGYLHRPELTRERFIPHPLRDAPGARLYRTGDLARRRSDGALEFLGRVDEQVKLHGHRIELGEIEAVLAAHPAVASCAVVVREDTPGDRRLVGYVVQDAQAAEPEALQPLRHDQVAGWRTIFEQTHVDDPAGADPTFDTHGWTDSYDLQPIPADLMRLWRDASVRRIAALAPDRVWEIGCGSGLMLFPLAHRCTEYLGTDFLQASLDRLRPLVARCGLAGVRLEQREAIACDGVPPGRFDVVVLNSVVQYFPDETYLRQVIAGVVPTVAPGGAIFLGDVRDFDLLPTFHASIQRHRNGGELSPAALAEAQRAVREEEELLVSPGYLHWLCGQIPGLGHADVQLRRGRGRDEMTRYRYDATLYVGAAPPPVEIAARRDWRDVGGLADLARWLTAERPAAAELLGVPNARLAADVHAPSGEPTAMAIDPEALWDLADELGYRVRLRGSAVHGLGSMDALWEQGPPAGPPRPWPAPATLVHPREWHSNPLRGKQERAMGAALREHLRRALPEAMIPATLVLLDALPTTATGKVDRKGLPSPAGERRQRQYVAPRTPAERVLAEVFAQVLGLERVSVHENFFELGGHSLLTIRLVGQAERAGLSLAVRDVFIHPTVAELARGLSRQTARSLAVPIARGSQPGLIVLIPAVGGHLAEPMIQLALGIAGGRSVLGMTTPPHARLGRMPGTLAELCGLYRHELLARVDTGPFVVLGYCFGGFGALELAHQLERAGHTVARVILLETESPAVALAQRGAFDRVSALIRIADRWNLGLDSVTLSRLPDEHVIQQILVAMAAGDVASAETETTLRAILESQEAQMRMLDTWTARIPNAPVHLLRCREAPEGIPWDYGWSEHGTLTSLQHLPGDHFGVVRPPHLEATIHAITALL